MPSRNEDLQYEEVQVLALVSAYTAPEEEEEMPEEDSWQISCLVSAATYTVEPDAGRVMTGRMKVM